MMAIEKIRGGLAGYPKDQVRYRTAKNLYCNSVEFRCYFHDPDEVEKFARTTLNEFNLVRSPCLGGDEQKCPIMLCREAELVVQYHQQSGKKPGKGR